jgi:hypothetical protein
MILSIITINSKSFNISKVRFELKLVRIISMIKYSNQNDIQSERDAEEVTTLSRPRPVVRHQASSPFQMSYSYRRHRRPQCPRMFRQLTTIVAETYLRPLAAELFAHKIS